MGKEVANNHTMLFRYDLEELLPIVIENLFDILDAYFTIKSKLISQKRIFSQRFCCFSKPSLFSHKQRLSFYTFPTCVRKRKQGRAGLHMVFSKFESKNC